MKRIIAVIMAAMLMLSLAACGTNNGGNTQDTQGTTAPASTIASALEILETVWASYPEESKFPVGGGDMLT